MSFFFFNDTATTEIYTLSLHDALPIFKACITSVSCGVIRVMFPIAVFPLSVRMVVRSSWVRPGWRAKMFVRSEEHTSELQSRQYLVCRLLLEKKKTYSAGHKIRHISHN